MALKIKLMGDVYMCAAGLFGNASPQVAVELIVLFAIDCLQRAEDQSVKMDTDLAVRIGINTGRPIIAGLLGTTKYIAPKYNTDG
jgi:class 3 adenylate cyclase